MRERGLECTRYSLGLTLELENGLQLEVNLETSLYNCYGLVGNVG
ncbi:unnamed protein product, partial [marine sediment metagenome]